MSVPLDRLYNYLDDISQEDIIIYRFFPHGSKKLQDLGPLKPLRSRVHELTVPFVFMHDQEPLNYHYYSQEQLTQHIIAQSQSKILDSMPPKIVEDFFTNATKDFNLRTVATPYNCFAKTVLCHSEINSPDLELYRPHGFVGAYWWSHALISRDWFRYAQHDPQLLRMPETFEKDFLIYNRAWSGTREYRLTLIEMLIEQELADYCLTTFSRRDQDIDYTQHEFHNQGLRINRRDLEDFFPANTYGPHASADYHAQDYSRCGIEVVLETLFDDPRIHLTEKSLRPIACGKSFILAATAGSLQYLRSYGFQTFEPWIDETYDTIEDPKKRLTAIVQEMRRIANLDPAEKQALWASCRERTDHNRRLFFSDHWQAKIVQEYKTNMQQAIEEVRTSLDGKHWLIWQDLQKRHLTRSLPDFRIKDIDYMFSWLAQHKKP